MLHCDFSADQQQRCLNAKVPVLASNSDRHGNARASTFASWPGEKFEMFFDEGEVGPCLVRLAQRRMFLFGMTHVWPSAASVGDPCRALLARRMGSELTNPVDFARGLTHRRDAPLPCARGQL